MSFRRSQIGHALENPRFAAIILSIVVFTAPILAMVNARVLVPLLLVTTLLVAASMIWRRERLKFRLLPLGIIGLTIIVWALLSSAWSADPTLSLRGTAKLTGNFVLAFLTLYLLQQVLEDGQAQLVRKALVASFVLGASILLFEGLTNGYLSGLVLGAEASKIGLFWLNRAGAVLALFAWPASAILLQLGWVYALLPFFALIVISFLIGFDTLVVALFASALAAGALYLRWSTVRPIFAALLILTIIAPPVVFSKVVNPIEMAKIDSLSKPLVHRFHIWRFTSDKILERPIIGYGMNSARTMSDKTTRIRDDIRGDYGERLPLHPHNFALQIWLELGGVGALLFTAAFVFLFCHLTNLTVSKREAVIFVGQFVISGALLSSSFGIWQSWFLASLWITIGATVAALSGLDRSPS